MMKRTGGAFVESCDKASANPDGRSGFVRSGHHSAYNERQLSGRETFRVSSGGCEKDMTCLESE